MDKVGGVPPKAGGPGCRRCLFGRVDGRVRQRVQEELAAIRQHDQHRWNFDFDKEEPLEGRYAWSPVHGAQSEGAASTCTAVSHGQGGSSIGNPCPGGSGTTGHGDWRCSTGGALEDTCGGHIEDSALMEESRISDPTPLEELTGGLSPGGSSSSIGSRLNPSSDQLLQGAGFYPVPPDSGTQLMPSIPPGVLSPSPCSLHLRQPSSLPASEVLCTIIWGCQDQEEG